MKQSKGSKCLKAVRLSRLDGVRDVALGHKATADRATRNYAKSEYSQGHADDSSFADVYERRKRYGF